MLLVMATILIFNVSAPIVLVGGIWYFGLRLISDCYTLIVVNKKEIESNAKYVKIASIVAVQHVATELFHNRAMAVGENRWVLASGRLLSDDPLPDGVRGMGGRELHLPKAICRLGENL